MSLYPHVRVDLRTSNPLVLVAAVRQALRRAGVARREIQRFTAEALAQSDGAATRQVCRQWVETGHR